MSWNFRRNLVFSKLYMVIVSILTMTTLSYADGLMISGDKIYFPDGSFSTTAPKDGKSILNGSGSPNIIGNIGDFYIDTANNRLYGPYNGTWGSGVSLVGPQGPKGDIGLMGPQGPSSNVTKYDLCNIYISEGETLPKFCKKQIFVTSQSYSGDLGGLSGADSKCQQLASTAGLKGIFKAWLSDSTTSASSRLTHSELPYFGTDGNMIASNWQSLTSTGNIIHLNSGIRIDENKIDKYISNTRTYIWTGSTYQGNTYYEDISSPQKSTCRDWTFSGSYYTDAGGIHYTYGAVGRVGYIDDFWTFDGWTLPCNSAFSLICIEQ